MAFLDPADCAARLLRGPLTESRLRKFARLCKTEAVWEAALAAIPEAQRDQVRAGTQALMAPHGSIHPRYPS